MKRKIMIDAEEEKDIQVNAIAKKICVDWSLAKAEIKDNVLILEHSPKAQEFTVKFLNQDEDYLYEVDTKLDEHGAYVSISAETKVVLTKKFNVEYYIPPDLNVTVNFDKFRIDGLFDQMEDNNEWKEFINKDEKWYNEVYDFWTNFDMDSDTGCSDNLFEWIYAIGQCTRSGHMYIPLTKLIHLANCIDTSYNIISILLSTAHIMIHSEKYKNKSMARVIFTCIMEEFLGGNRSLHQPEAERVLYEFVKNGELLNKD